MQKDEKMYGQRIKKLIALTGKNGAEVARGLGWTKQYFGQICNDNTTPSAEKLVTISLYFSSQLKSEVNLKWLLTGEGEMFILQNSVSSNAFTELKEKFNMSDEDMEGLIELLQSGASRDMVLKFIQVKKGNKEALDALIQNLNGVKAAYNFGV